ncbi:hypothetical protein [Pedobacter sp. JY14-1]|uniref:hypothetical protein n=1 Tax=Pedobacter sp. JY14-1 TaxID=3034151 RepID=UPI0023E0F899|nr:hypothetical protein [Pedobacter sp. JY14-1]
MTVSGALIALMQRYNLNKNELAEVLKVSSHSMRAIFKEEKELSFLMGLRLLKHFGLSADEFAGLLSEKEFGREELSVIRYWEKLELRRAYETPGQPLTAQSIRMLPGKYLLAALMEKIQDNEDLKRMTERFASGEENLV